MTNENTDTATSPEMTEANYEASGNFPIILDQLGISLLVSTYQAGKLLVLGSHQGTLTVSFNSFEQVMGIAIQPEKIAIGTFGQIWFLQSVPELAARIEPAGKHDACFLATSSHMTEQIHGHDLAWGENELWIVNTLFSCLCTIDDGYNFVPRWQPRFISTLAAEDRCHLNGLAMENGRPRFVTVMAETDSAGGWRPTKATSGCIIDVPSGETVARGLAMPHSPRIHKGQLFVLDSGHGCLSYVDQATGNVQQIVRLPGYTRGLSIHGDYAFVGLSRIRETSVFGGIPIGADRENLKCGVAVVDLQRGQHVASFFFQSGVAEIFAVEVLPGFRCPFTYGPKSSREESSPIWYAPGPVPIDKTRTLSQKEIEERVARADHHRRNGEWAPAVDYYRQVLDACPELADVAANLGRVLQNQGRYSEAKAAYDQSLNIEPNQPDLLMWYGSLLRLSNKLEDARRLYHRALELEPRNSYLHANIAQTLSDEGRVDEAYVHFETSNQIEPIPDAKIAAAIMLPPIYQSVDDLQRRRQQLIDRIEGLHRDGVRLDPTTSVAPHLFFPAYHGLNDRDIFRRYTALFTPPAGAVRPMERKPSGKIRVGLISAFFKNHTIGLLNRGLVEKLDRKQFHVTVFTTSPTNDFVAHAMQQHADNYLVVPEHLGTARQMIAEQQLDILLYADIGMSPFTHSLAFSRLAPVQCVTWGHPQTSGIPTIDYFISGEDLDLPEAQSHYTEKLVRLPGIQTYYYRPKIEGEIRDRSYFDLPGEVNLYGCPQSLFKFHPEFDEILSGILRSDPNGLLVLLKGKHDYWTDSLMRRWNSVMPDVINQIRFLQPVPREEFLSLISQFNVSLDPIHFGGGNTSFEAFAMGVPVVTLPSQFLRGRITYAQYQMMGMTECCVASPAQYIELAVKIGTDPNYRKQLSGKLNERSSRIFERQENIFAIEEFFTSILGV